MSTIQIGSISLPVNGSVVDVESHGPYITQLSTALVVVVVGVVVVVVFVVVEFVKVDAGESFLCVSKKKYFFSVFRLVNFFCTLCVCVRGGN